MEKAKSKDLALEPIKRQLGESLCLIKTLEKSNAELREELEHLRLQSRTDFLTGIYNRRCFDESLSREYKRALRNGYPICLIMIDLDNFKQLNDAYGHHEGDKFLIHFAQFLQSHVKRANDSVYRLGGDEFAVLLVNMPLEKAQEFCIFLQAEFAKTNSNKAVSLSIGELFVPANYKTQPDDLVRTADKLMYQAKKQGKNTICRQDLTYAEAP